MVDSDPNSAQFLTCSHQDTYVSGRSTVGELHGHTTRNLCNVPISNRFSSLSYPDACSEHEELDEGTVLDLVICQNVHKRKLPVSLAAEQDIDASVHVSCIQTEDMDAFASSLQLPGLGFDSAQSPNIHIPDSASTRPLITKSLQQLGCEFGCIPLGNFQLYAGPSVIWQSVPDIIEAHKLIRASGLPIFLGQRIPVNSDLNIPSWRKHLCDYCDQQLVDLIQYGFPLDFDRNLDLFSIFKNHASAVEFASHVDEYIKEELHHGALLGLLDHPPFDIHISPLHDPT